MRTFGITNDYDITSLRAGDAVTFSGAIYTARDAAHKRMTEAAAAGSPLPSISAARRYTTPGPLPREAARS